MHSIWKPVDVWLSTVQLSKGSGSPVFFSKRTTRKHRHWDIYCSSLGPDQATNRTDSQAFVRNFACKHPPFGALRGCWLKINKPSGNYSLVNPPKLPKQNAKVPKSSTNHSAAGTLAKPLPAKHKQKARKTESS